MKPDAHKGYLALGTDKRGRICVLTAAVGQDVEAIVVATEERLKAECAQQEFTLKRMVPAAVGSILSSAAKEGAVYVMDAECYNFLVEAVSYFIDRYRWRMARLVAQPLDAAWHTYAATKTKQASEALVKRLAVEGSLIEVREHAP